MLFPVEEKAWFFQFIAEPKDNNEKGMLSVDALKEMVAWDSRMRTITEYESTTVDDNLVLERSNSGPTYKYENICRKQTLEYTYYQDCSPVYDIDGNLKEDECGPKTCVPLV